MDFQLIHLTQWKFFPDGSQTSFTVHYVDGLNGTPLTGKATKLLVEVPTDTVYISPSDSSAGLDLTAKYIRDSPVT